MGWRNVNLVQRCVCAAALALAAWAAGAYPDLFILERTAVASGELWRLWTGHLVHGSATHYAYDVGAFVLLCGVYGPRLRLLWLAPLIGVALLVWLPNMQYYYGLSALLHAWAVMIMAEIWREECGLRSYFAALLALGVFAKALLETGLGASVFTADINFGGPVLHASHLVGATVGLVASCACYLRLPRTQATNLQKGP